MKSARIAGWMPALLIFWLGTWLWPGKAFLSNTGFQVQSSPIPTRAVEGSAQAAILSIVPGQALQGSIPVDVFTAVDSFQSAELSFAFHDQAAKTWFLIAESFNPVSEGTLAIWDTTTITDGVYDLQLVVGLQDGSRQQVVVEAVRVRNYSPVETDTPTPAPTLRPGETLTATPAPPGTPTPVRPTFTPLAANPAQVSTTQWTASLGRGGMAAGSAFALIGLYTLAKTLRKRR